MSIGPACDCTEERTGSNGRQRIVCTCPIPSDRKPAMQYGVKKSVWRQISRRVIARDNYTCRYCGTTQGQMQADHVLAFTRGGTNDESNLVAACADCNRRKKNMSLEDWLR